jgi:hypothetical protein
MSSLFHHVLGMFVKDRVGLRPSIGDSPLVGGKEKGRARWELSGARMLVVVLYQIEFARGLIFVLLAL